MRTTIVSTSKLKTYQTVVLSVILLVTLFVAVYVMISVIKFEKYYPLFTLPAYIILAYKAIPAVSKIRSVSYDDGSIYYVKKDYEVQIPFDDIKSIDIKSLDGVYEIMLYTPTQIGDRVYFKTSLWYPFNFKKQDEKVNELRHKIDRYKRTLPEKNFTGLSSYSI